MIESLSGIRDKVVAAPDDWKELFDSQHPESMLDKLPGDFKSKTDF